MADYEIDVEKLTRKAMRALTWRLRLTRAALLVERGMTCFWPLITLTLLLVALGRLGLLLTLDKPVLIGGLVVAVVLCLWFLLRGARGFHWPTMADAKARIDAKMPGRPLQSLDDSMAVGASDPAARYLWARHLQRMADQARGAEAAQPHVRLSRRDPWALRLIAVFVFAAAALFGRTDPVQSLVQSLTDEGALIATGPSWEGWAEPPAYTGKPAVYLNDIANGETLSLPEGTRITLRVYGDTEGAALSETVSAGGDTALMSGETGFAETTLDISKSGRLSLVPPQGPDAGWDIAMIADEDPQVVLTDEISRTVQGALKLPFEARDDYGVEGGTVTIELALDAVDRRYGLVLDPEPRETLTLELPLPFTRKTASFEETLVEDLAEHPWAGLPVQIVLTVEDALGQTGSVLPEIGPMPGKRFFDTMAAAVAEQRRDLLWNRDNRDRIVQVLKAITHRPEVAFKRRGEKAYLMIRTAMRRMEYAGDDRLSDTVRDEVAALLWKAALLIEDGDLADARERLKRAQERLSEAMKNGATQDEIQQLMDELRQATNDYMRQLAEEQRKDGQENQQAENGQTREMTQDQLQQLLDRIQELMEQGRMAEAQELMEQLQQMMENMRVTEGQGGGEGGQNQQAMEGLGDTLREQQDLADDTYRELQEEYDRNRRELRESQDPPLQDGDQQGQQDGQQNGQGEPNGQQQGQGPRGRDQGQGAGPGQLAERQQALRDMLEQQRREMNRNGVNGGEEFERSLEEAERQMGEAEGNLEDGNSAGALDNQANALEALREGMRQLGDTQRQAQSGQAGQQGSQPGQGDQNARDPLGRPLSESGRVGSNEKLVPSEEQYRRSREVMDEIRKRSGERNRPTLELDYLKRLLDRF
ncbi:TIGR02302 family protein [Neptunicoccus cionae]|uniref:ATPase n=1 Tax=Neptunicoccus cionae TaxID=2035344 RepID=A0A916QZA4_9RHOB|nr:TIGR02302 family protein [Amylibacter cionae]GGA16101.1 ATPase [Amylibacter cionae]